MLFAQTQDLIVTAVWVLFLALKGWAAIDCATRRSDAFPAVGRQSKTLWLLLTAIAALTGLLPGLTLGIIGIAGIVVALVYLFDVRTRIIAITGGRR